MASSRKTGTNPSRWTGATWEAGVNTYDSGGGKDYTALATWEADTDVDIVTATVSPVLEVYGNNHNDGASIAGATSSSTYFRIVRPASGNFLTSGAITSKHFNRASSTSVFTLADAYVQIQDMVVTNSSINSASLFNAFLLNNGDQSSVVGCVAIDIANAGAGGGTGFVLTSAAGKKVFAINCLAHNCKTDGFQLTSTSTQAYCYNCTATNNGNYGFNGASSTYDILKNCGATGNGTAEIENGTFSETTDSESAPTFAAGTDNFHLASGDTTWKDAGTDLSGDAAYAFDDDIDKATRTGTWDIGWDEYVSAGGGDLSINVSDCVAPITLLGG